MAQFLILDTGILAQIVHRDKARAKIIRDYLNANHADSVIVIPEVADYEVRRSLLKIDSVNSIKKLDGLSTQFMYQAISTLIMQRAAQVWATCRKSGKPLADDKSLDGDCILIAQAQSVEGQVVVLTTNRKHIELFVKCEEV